VNLFRGELGRPLVIGHRGAAALAPENTLASLQAALAAGVDVVEFDISPGLRLGHSLEELPDDELSLDEALEFLGPQGVGLHLDVKLPGYEDGVLDAIRRHGLEDRAYVSTAFALTGRRIAAQAPGCTVAIGYPRDRVGISKLRWPETLTRAGAATLRQVMPLRVPLLLRWARANALSLHQTLCSRAAVKVAHRLGAPVLAWTANDPATVRRLAAAGVDGIVSDDPGMALETLATLLAQ
jgi:glycerophosphoryl diester phosphodiesterase